MEVVESRRAAFPFYFILIWWTIPCACCWMEGRKRWASECWCDSTEWCVNVAPATADEVVPFFLFLMGRICWCRTHRGGCRGFVSYSSFDHQLQPTLRHGKYEIRNTTTKFNQKNSSATPLAGGSEKLSKFIIRLELFPFSHVIHPLRLLASNSLTDTPFLLFLLLLLPFLLRDLRIHHINPHSQYPNQPHIGRDGTGNASPTFKHIHETFEILKVKEEKRNYFSRNAICL